MEAADARDGRYRLRDGWRPVPWVVGALAIVNGIVVVISGLDDEGLALWLRLGFGPASVFAGLYLILGTIRAIEVRADAVRLVSVVRTVVIPWADLGAVELVRRELGHQIVWSRRNGRPLRTLARWERQDEMLAAIHRHLAATHGRGEASEASRPPET